MRNMRKHVYIAKQNLCWESQLPSVVREISQPTSKNKPLDYFGLSKLTKGSRINNIYHYIFQLETFINYSSKCQNNREAASTRLPGKQFLTQGMLIKSLDLKQIRNIHFLREHIGTYINTYREPQAIHFTINLFILQIFYSV